MALIVETGVGLSTAESYISVAEFLAYAYKNYAVTDPVATDAIEQALRRATRFIDGAYRKHFLGYRTQAYNQALEWPRAWVVRPWPGASGYNQGYYSQAGDVLANNVIPQSLKEATAEAAIRELASPGSLTPDRVPSEQILQETVGPITTVFANVSDSRPIVTLIDEILAPLMTQSGIAVRA